MKTLEETKKGLEICYHSVGCDECPYRYKPWADGCRCVDGLQSDALAHIEQLESQIPRWIPVEEMLPEENSVVLIYWVYHFFEATYLGDGNFRVLGGQVISAIPANSTFTHWMHLPEPPEEAKTNG